MRIVIYLDTDNEAFGNGMYEEAVEQVLLTLATKVANGEDAGCISSGAEINSAATARR
jgi:hypothetical protein